RKGRGGGNLRCLANSRNNRAINSGLSCSKGSLNAETPSGDACLEGRKKDSRRNRTNFAVVAQTFRREHHDGLDFDAKTSAQFQVRTNAVAVRGVTHRIA